MKWIKERRKELSLSQNDLARELQLHGYDYVRATIGHWESGYAPPPFGDPEFVRTFAKILRLDVGTVLHLSGYGIPVQHGEVSERIARIVDTFDETKQALALRLVEQLMD